MTQTSDIAPTVGNGPSWSVQTVALLLSKRTTAAVLLAGLAVYLLAGTLPGPPLYRCPLHALTALPCPGCGLTRAARLLLHGRLTAMGRVHPFAPYFALWALMLGGAALLPAAWRQRWTAAWTAAEARSGLHAVMLTGFVIFGVVRLLWHIARPG